MPPTRRSTSAIGTHQLEKPFVVVKASNTAFGDAGTSTESCSERSPLGSTNDVLLTSLKSRQLGAAKAALGTMIAAAISNETLLNIVPSRCGGAFQPREVISERSDRRVELFECPVRARL